MAEIIRYEIGFDYQPGQHMRDGSVVDLPVYGIDAIYDSDPGQPRKRTGPYRHRLAITVFTTDGDRRTCLDALNRRLGLDIAGRSASSSRQEILPSGLADAVYALEELASGRNPDRVRVIAGALALNTLIHRGENDRDVLDAAAGLASVTTGGSLDLDEAGRRRAGVLADVVRRIAAGVAPGGGT
jgi:hypothetical protein